MAALICACGLKTARADVAVMVPPRSDQSLSSDSVEAASLELSRLLRLQGFDVISDGQAAAFAEGQQRNGAFPRNYDPVFCITPECANEYRKLFDALFAVQLTIGSKAGRPKNVTVVLTEDARASYAATAPVNGGDLRAAVRVAYEDAREKQRDGGGPWLSVTGVPDGAKVYVDEVEFGRVPFQKHRIAPGQHRLETRADDHLTDTRTINVAENIDHVETQVIALKPVDKPLRTSERAPRIRRSGWDWALGGAVAAAGAAHLAAGIYQLSKDGDCAAHADGRCTDVYGSDGGASRGRLMVGLGAAGMAVGGLVMGFGPIANFGLQANREHAVLQLKGTF